MKKKLKEQYTIPASHPDLSKIPGSFSHWLEKNFDKIERERMYNDKEKLINYLERAPVGVGTSDKYFNKFIDTIKSLTNPKKIQQLLYNAYLKGAGLGIN